jgi:hypothetical protein
MKTLTGIDIIWLPAGIAVTLIILLFSGCNKDKMIDFDFKPLEFHFADPDDIDYIASFGYPDWSGPGLPHNGIDLRISMDAGSSVIISPSNGTVKRITMDKIGVGVEIQINEEYMVMVGFEPGDTSEYLQPQREALRVETGQVVHAGDTLGDLLIGRLGYPHIHIMLNINRRDYCPYNYSSVRAKNIYDMIVEEREASLFCGEICCEESVAQ